ncbi:hypothetical protein BS329_17000 [Amycolatopsis coloradensis]|uniref:HTH cro/C1-type domain-containing protein n=1 Tax=Amycolatopsis coloradensis TaxID=76021 RepID=A0A1R0KTX0_9PSEU|nr:helix-turn-helix transcriptional regulator [Amycolatopsis coloradensis]OLZ51477.1 hypothetical protein BS329_17000 [Amycolatopsis coloradensis]
MDFRESTVGERIEALRRRRGLSRKTLAGLVGRSQEWLRQVEKGSRRMDSIEVLVRMSEVLRVSDSSLLLPGFAFSGGRSGERVGGSLTDHLRRSLFLLDVYPENLAEQRPDAQSVSTLATEADWLWGDWVASGRRFDPVGRKTSELLSRSWQVCEVLPCQCGDGLSPACRAHVRMLLLMASLFSRLAEHELAYFAVHQAARRAGHHSVTSPDIECGPALAHALSRLGYSTEALPIAVEAVRRHRDGPAGVLTALHLSVAEVAAMGGDHRTCERYLASAEELALDQAGRSGEERVIGSASVSARKALCMLRLGQADLALHVAEEVRAEEVRAEEDHPADEVVDLYLALAQVWVARREDVTALLTLLRVERVSPDDLYYSRSAARLLDTLQQSALPTVRAEATSLVDRIVPSSWKPS